MLAEVSISQVVTLLAAHLRGRLAELDSYLRTTFGVPAPVPLPVMLHLSQMEDGSVNPPNIGHNFASVRLVEADAVPVVALDFEWRTRFRTDKSDRPSRWRQGAG
jgi:hypothetical protein